MFKGSPQKQKETVEDCLKGFLRDAERHERSRYIYEITALTVSTILENSGINIGEQISTLTGALIRLKLSQFILVNTREKMELNEGVTEIERALVSLRIRHLVSDLEGTSEQGVKTDFFKVAA